MASIWNFKTPGVPDDYFITDESVPGPTKEEVRVLTMSKARLNDGDTVIDVGCGTGGLTVEAALQVGSMGRVYSLDEDVVAVRLTKSNVEKFGVQDQVVVRHGRAPEGLAEFPCANAVLIGGTMDLREVLRVVQTKLVSNGRVVVNAILLETATMAIDELGKLGFKDIEVVHVSISKGKQIKSGTMMLARNPIMIVSALKIGDT
ncbi:MAG: precorrin-6Y C5,15-methyltransferase (decarboxylating) subunit CbiT [Nitrososphaerota archaeon]|jgi:cobalt-precorrin-6B (C15)-methyltransferase|nr:precorrin-6Y C5,15-methyltransferase (decarboxylating) subunit CbiT [Nitrososphaerota archaeon]